MELDYIAIGKRIKIARIRSELTQDKLSEIINISPSHMSNIETGTTKVSLQTLTSLANALSVTMDDLLCDNIVTARPKFEEEIQQLLSKCDDYDIRIVKDTLSSLVNSLEQNARLRGNTAPQYPEK